MGGGRKRAIESSYPSSERKDGKPRKKKDKKKGKQRDKEGGSSSSDLHQQNKSSLDSTATPEGKTMAQVMSTFSRLEQSRFEAFRRATFPADVISKFVAHCLIEEQHRPVSRGVPISTQLEAQYPSRAPVLSEVCAPGQSSEITMIASTLAKSYAQRLVTAARKRATDRSNIRSNNHNNNGGNVSVVDGIVSITSDDILKAWRERQAQGLDPGFFLQPYLSQRQPPCLLGTTATLDQQQSHQRKRLAALQAQEEYDQVHGVPMEVEDEDNDDDDDRLDVDWGDDNEGKSNERENAVAIANNKEMSSAQK